MCFVSARANCLQNNFIGIKMILFYRDKKRNIEIFHGLKIYLTLKFISITFFDWIIRYLKFINPMLKHCVKYQFQLIKQKLVTTYMVS